MKKEERTNMTGRTKILTQHFQDCILRLAITDTEFLRVLRFALPVSYLDSIYHELMQLCYNYYDGVNEAPGDHFQDEMIRRLFPKFDDDMKKLYFGLINRIGEVGVPNKEYISQILNQFIRQRELETALMQAAPLAERGEFEEVEQILMKALKSGIPLEEGFLKIPDDGSDFLKKDAASELICNLGIPLLDERIKGLRRGQLVCFFAPAKGGKTWACINVAYQAMTIGRRVLYLTHELSAREVGERIYMKAGGLSNLDEPREITIQYLNDEEVECEEHITPGSVQDLDKQEEVARLLSRNCGKLYIRKYPMGTCTLGEIERLLDYLEIVEHFIPDVLITDYVEIMALPKHDSPHDSINEAYIRLKSIADQRSILVITASQVTRAGYGKSHIAQSHLPAGDIRKLANIDLGLSFCANELQTSQNLMNVYVEINRSGPQGFGCTIYNLFEVGQFAHYCKPFSVQPTTERPDAREE